MGSVEIASSVGIGHCQVVRIAQTDLGPGYCEAVINVKFVLTVKMVDCPVCKGFVLFFKWSGGEIHSLLSSKTLNSSP